LGVVIWATGLVLESMADAAKLSAYLG